VIGAILSRAISTVSITVTVVVQGILAGISWERITWFSELVMFGVFAQRFESGRRICGEGCSGTRTVLLLMHMLLVKMLAIYGLIRIVERIIRDIGVFVICVVATMPTTEGGDLMRCWYWWIAHQIDFGRARTCVEGVGWADAT
jgi:hypothetical protein